MATSSAPTRTNGFANCSILSSSRTWYRQSSARGAVSVAPTVSVVAVVGYRVNVSSPGGSTSSENRTVGSSMRRRLWVIIIVGAHIRILQDCCGRRCCYSSCMAGWMVGLIARRVHIIDWRSVGWMQARAQCFASAYLYAEEIVGTSRYPFGRSASSIAAYNKVSRGRCSRSMF